MPLLSESAREKMCGVTGRPSYRSERGELEAGKAALEQLAGERDYYGFLAADKLGRPYSFNHEYLVMTDSIAGDVACQRCSALRN